MPSITLNKKALDKLSAFAKKHGSAKWFMAKDEGAYVGCSTGKENCIFYFAGCDPTKNPDTYYDEAHYKFGGDDFGEHFDIAVIHKLADNPNTTKMVLNIGKTTMSIKSWAKKPKPIIVDPAYAAEVAKTKAHIAKLMAEAQQ